MCQLHIQFGNHQLYDHEQYRQASRTASWFFLGVERARALVLKNFRRPRSATASTATAELRVTACHLLPERSHEHHDLAEVGRVPAQLARHAQHGGERAQAPVVVRLLRQLLLSYVVQHGHLFGKDLLKNSYI